MLLTPYVVPPDKRECAPSTTIIVEGVLLTVLKDFFQVLNVFVIHRENIHQ